MTYKGKFRPRVPKKYRGDYTNIIYRSSWELKFMKYCDTNKNILEWGSEEFFIPYMSPNDNRVHKYFPDFYIKVRENGGKIKKYIIEVKPKRQTTPPAKPRRQTKGYLREAFEFAKNKAKWSAANEWCVDRGFEFKILTEKELGIK